MVPHLQHVVEEHPYQLDPLCLVLTHGKPPVLDVDLVEGPVSIVHRPDLTVDSPVVDQTVLALTDAGGLLPIIV